MSTGEQLPAMATTNSTKNDSVTATKVTATADAAIVEQNRSDILLKAKELYSHGSRNFLVKNYVEAADELSQVCGLYEEFYGELSDELGMPYLLYAKSLIALALDENKVIDVPDEEDMDDDDDDDDDENSEGNGADDGSAKSNGEASSSTVNGSTSGATKKLDAINEDDVVKKCGEADSSAEGNEVSVQPNEKSAPEKFLGETQVSSTDDQSENAQKQTDNGATSSSTPVTTPAALVVDGEKPSTSNRDTENGAEEEDEENEAATNLQLAWEILELAAKIFSRQGMGGLPNLAEVQTELANIEFENNIPEAAREDYEKALKIYGELPTNYRRAMAEIHYKIGLTYLMQHLNKEGAESLKAACNLIDGEIDEIKAKSELSEKEKNNIQDMEETKQEIWAKIAEIEDTQAQNVAEVRAALDSYIKPIGSDNADGAGPSCAGASSSISSSTKPNDISHLIKRKKPEEPSSEAEAAASPAKKPAL